MDKKYKDFKFDIDLQIKGQLNHNKNVKKNGEILTSEINRRLAIHDQDKLVTPELWARFQIISGSKVTFGTPEYNKMIKEIDVHELVKHHRESNPHHPEYFGGDFSKMSVIDLTEMAADWYTANSMRPSGTDWDKLLDYQQKTYGFSDDIRSIFENTINYLVAFNSK